MQGHHHYGRRTYPAGQELIKWHLIKAKEEKRRQSFDLDANSGSVYAHTGQGQGTRSMNDRQTDNQPG